MHLLSAQSGEVQQEGEAIDLEQSPSKIIFASFADSELAAIAGAIDRAGENEVRLANILSLSHNFSIDLWLEKTVQHAKLVVIRLLGGVSYWQYGVDELSALAQNKNIKLAFISGDANPDAILLKRSTISSDEWHILHNLFIAGGAQNMDLALLAFNDLADDKAVLDIKAKPFLRFGFWLPNEGMIGIDEFCGSTPRPDNSTSSLVEGREKPLYIPILFYRAALDGAGIAAIKMLYVQLEKANFTPIPIVISSLKEGACIRFVKEAFRQFPPQVILNLTGFSLGIDGIKKKQNPFSEIDAPIVQLIQSSRPREVWEKDYQGLSAKDLAMQIVLPEMDGRIGALIIGHKEKSLWHEKSQCQLISYRSEKKGIKQAVELVKNYVRLRLAKRSERKVVMVLANYPIRDGRIANGVGYDAPLSSVEIMMALEKAGYDLGSEENSFTLRQAQGEGGVCGEGGVQEVKKGNQLIELLQSGPTNANPKRGIGGAILSLVEYRKLFKKLPIKIQDEVNGRWGEAKEDPFCRADGFHLPVVIFSHIAVLLQPSRGYNLDEEASYHDPDLVPPHAYIASYLWAKNIFKTHAFIHNGKHGNLEWLPGKAVAQDENSYPNALWGALPNFYPFIVNDPGEGTQAKRRIGAVIIDHLVPPLTRAETYGNLRDLEALLDEYYAASGMDNRRLNLLKKRILDFSKDIDLADDISLPKDENEALGEIDNFLCELKEAQIRDGLHVFGQSPTGRLEQDLSIALARVPRGEGAQNASIIRAIANDLKLGFDPLNVKLGEKYKGAKPKILKDISNDIWRNVGDTIERLEALALELIEQEELPQDFVQTKEVMITINEVIRPKLQQCGTSEINALIDGLDGKFIKPGSSGAPSRGRLDVLPTGRNFYSVDTRAVPTQVAWELGKKSAENMLKRYFQDEGVWLKSIALSVWGTANMRTGGDDIAQALALIGVKPKWDFGSLRINGFEIIPLAKLARPRVDVTLKISGFFRDAFPQLITLFDKAIRAVGSLDEPMEQNPIAATMRKEALEMIKENTPQDEAFFSAGHRIFGSKPGAYGAGLQGLMDSGKWENKGDISKAFVNWGQYVYGAKIKGEAKKELFKTRLKNIDAVVHNQDNREHDLLDSDDYYQFEGGLFASIETLKGTKPIAYHNDHSRIENPKTRSLEEEISFVMRSRVVNPKWIDGVKRHGYKGAFEIIACVDYMFAFAATTGAVKSYHFDLAFEAFIKNDEVSDFIKKNNAFGFEELKNKFNEAIKRGLWQPKSNYVFAFFEGEKNE